MPLLTHPDLKQIVKRTYKYQILGPSWICLTGNLLHSFRWISPLTWRLIYTAGLISIAVGAAMIAVYGLVHVFTKLAQPKDKE